MSAGIAIVEIICADCAAPICIEPHADGFPMNIGRILCVVCKDTHPVDRCRLDFDRKRCDRHGSALPCTLFGPLERLPGAKEWHDKAVAEYDAIPFRERYNYESVYQKSGARILAVVPAKSAAKALVAAKSAAELRRTGNARAWFCTDHRSYECACSMSPQALHLQACIAADARRAEASL